jgi:hypothetical protein
MNESLLTLTILKQDNAKNQFFSFHQLFLLFNKLIVACKSKESNFFTLKSRVKDKCEVKVFLCQQLIELL